LAKNPRNHCKALVLKEGQFWFYKIKKTFVNVDGPFLCLQNGGNSQVKNLVTSLMFILEFLKT
jgi:hypothetical protein